MSLAAGKLGSGIRHDYYGPRTISGPIVICARRGHAH